VWYRSHKLPKLKESLQEIRILLELVQSPYLKENLGKNNIVLSTASEKCEVLIKEIANFKSAAKDLGSHCTS